MEYLINPIQLHTLLIPSNDKKKPHKLTIQNIIKYIACV